MKEQEKILQPEEITREEYLLQLIAGRDYLRSILEQLSDSYTDSLKKYNKVVLAINQIREADELGLKARFYIDEASNQVLMMCEGRKKVGFTLPHERKRENTKEE